VYQFNHGYDLAIATGDADGDGVDEFAFTAATGIKLLKCTGPGQYEEVWQLNHPSHWLRFFDINQDGRDELIVPVESTYIFEDTLGLGIADFTRFPERSPVKVAPSVARLGTSLLFSGFPAGADIEVHSLDGKLVKRTQGARQSAWTWNLRDQSGNLVPAGTYFAVVRSKGKTTSLKLCLVK
jgi:hypothetical protein